jgi:hypothetical protein
VGDVTGGGTGLGAPAAGAGAAVRWGRRRTRDQTARGRGGPAPDRACYGDAVRTLRDNRDRLDRLARTLLDRETLDEDDAYAAAGVAREQAPGAVARGETPGSARAPGLPADGAQVPTG